MPFTVRIARFLPAPVACGTVSTSAAFASLAFARTPPSARRVAPPAVIVLDPFVELMAPHDPDLQTGKIYRPRQKPRSKHFFRPIFTGLFFDPAWQRRSEVIDQVFSEVTAATSHNIGVSRAEILDVDVQLPTDARFHVPRVWNSKAPLIISDTNLNHDVEHPNPLPV